MAPIPDPQSADVVMSDDRPVELLILICNPHCAQLADVFTEAHAAKAAVEKWHKRVEMFEWCTLSQLHEKLGELKPRIVLFIGHGDAHYGTTGRLTLGFTDERNNLVLMDPETIVKVIGAAPGLEIIVIQACETEELGQAVALHGVPTICWSTKLFDLAAKHFSVCARPHSNAGWSPLRSCFHGSLSSFAARLLRIHVRPGERYGRLGHRYGE